MNVDRLSATQFKITEEALDNSSSKIIPSGSVIIATRVGLGKVCVLENDTAINQDLRGVLPKKPKSIDPQFLFYWFHTLSKTIQNAGTGATVKGVKLPFVKSLPFPNIPLEEQKRIVAALDSAFEGLDRARAHVEANLQNARDLFESEVNSYFEMPDTNWKRSTLLDVTDLITCGVAARPDYFDDGIPFLSAKNVKRGRIIWSGHRYISAEKHAELTKRNKPQKGDILYTRVGSYGEAAIIDKDVEFSIFVSLTLIKPKSVLSSLFLKHFLNSNHVKGLAKKNVNSSGVGNLNVGAVRKFPISYPTLDEQYSLSTKMEKLSKCCENLEAEYQSKLDDLDDLRQALLQKAFAGALT